MPNEARLDNPVGHDSPPAQPTLVPDAGATNNQGLSAALKPSQLAAQNTVDSTFGGVTITDDRQKELCASLDMSPRTAFSSGVLANGDNSLYSWLNGVGHAMTAGADGKGATCVQYPDGTTVSASGQYTAATGDFIAGSNQGTEFPLNPTNIQVVSGKGKVELLSGAGGGILRSVTDPQGHAATDHPDGSMAEVAKAFSLQNDLKVLWGTADQDGPHVAITSPSDSAAMRAAVDQWKSLHQVGN